MKKVMLITAISSVVIFGCSKEELNEGALPSPGTQNIEYMPLAIGNYWVYNTYRIDTLGNETLYSSDDSAYVDRDTIIDGETYFIIEGDFNARHAVGSLLRNDGNNVLNLGGSITFTTNNLGSVYRNDTISIGGGEFIYMATWVNTSMSNISSPSGSFLCFDKETENTTTLSSYPWGTRRQHKYYSSGTGVVISQFYYFSSPDFNESRLVRYNIN